MRDTANGKRLTADESNGSEIQNKYKQFQIP